MNIQGLRHSEVVALIRAGGEEVRLLVVDPETDELFKRLGLTATSSQDKGQFVHTNPKTYAGYPSEKMSHMFWFAPSQRSM